MSLAHARAPRFDARSTQSSSTTTATAGNQAMNEQMHTSHEEEGGYLDTWASEYEASPTSLRGLEGNGLSPRAGAALAACFGPSWSEAVDFEVGTSADVASVNARATTMGSSVNLGGRSLAETDGLSMELLAHEAAHALAGGGSGEELLSRRDDPGERIAEDAGLQFRKYAEGGFSGPAPSLRPAVGGKAAIHRSEACEHVDAVDGAVDRLKESGDPALVALADNAAPMMEGTITLGNGEKLTPGQISALMGDFYGVFDDEGRLDVDGSFDQLWNADPDEMTSLLKLIEAESHGEHIPFTDWKKPHDALKGRDHAWTDPLTGDRSLSAPTFDMVDLAKRNTSHFSGPSMAGGEDNMGVYTALHQRALAEAASESGSLDRARALEACAMHYLTDRHAAGHAFEKHGVMEASGWEPGGTPANAFAGDLHDAMNPTGIYASNARGDRWTMFGDGAWGEDANERNRALTSESVAASFSELADTWNGARSPVEIEQTGFAAYDTVPAFVPGLQADAEQVTVDRDSVGVGARIGRKYGPDVAHDAAEEVQEAGSAVTEVVEDRVERTAGIDDWLWNEYARTEDWLKRGGR